MHVLTYSVKKADASEGVWNDESGQQSQTEVLGHQTSCPLRPTYNVQNQVFCPF